ncbi:MAG TPA: substrate-binding domain-containing protein [Vicinamibacterales bacterium]|jgi:D-xylose transport system substrate-binding protein|nr:substrate-binding domain-containing protein [Vicinamibacterales bacterium]
MRTRTLAMLFVCFSLACGGGSSSPRPAQQGPPARVKIGLLMDDVAQERWQRDRDIFIARAKELRAETVVRAADNDQAKQLQQAEELLKEGVKVLVVVPHDAEKAAAIVEIAKKQNVPVISYDRLIRNADVDLYVSFDNVKVGEMQARYLLDRAPRGNYLLIGGAPTDNNAKLLREGQMKVLEPAIKRGDVKIVGDYWADNWEAAPAEQHTEATLKKVRNNLAAVVASNDVTAGGVVRALQKHNLAGKVLVSGQDAELPAVQRLVAGTQAMTVYKRITPLARTAARSAVDLADGDKVDGTSTVNNGRKDVPALLLDGMPVDKENVEQTVVADGFHKKEEVFGAGTPKP